MRVPSVSAAANLRAVTFPRLSGGLNLQELDYRLGPDESPETRNLWWQDGVLQCRDGQETLLDTAAGQGFAACDLPFHGMLFFHIGSGIYAADPDAPQLRQLIAGVPENAGTFFRYQDSLFYKNRGGYVRIFADGDGLSAVHVAEEAFVPVTVLNARPADGGGDLYQPENRLSPRKTVRYTADGSAVYHLPYRELEAVEAVTVDGIPLETGWEADLTAGTVTFAVPPAVTEPPVSNSVEITVKQSNPAAFSAVMDCPHAIVGGGDRNLCILLGGCTAQPGAVFWNGNDQLSMNPAYFPMLCYNLVGEAADPVTGFGMQYGTLIVFQTGSVGKLGFETEELDGRVTLSFPYQCINRHIGCDLPGSIQLVENNLVFANRSRGVHILRSSSAAYENNVDCISRKVNGEREGLLAVLQTASVVTSFDDDSRYWLCADGRCWVWDYMISGASDPSWFYFTDIPAVSFFRDDSHRRYHLDAAGRITRFSRCFSDYGAGISKFYRFPTQFFGSYERRKDVTEVLLTVRSDTDTDVKIGYRTDFGDREDATPVRTYTWHLVPRNLTKRCLTTPRYAFVAKRKPGCRGVRHFAVTLENSRPGEDLAIVSMQMFYRLMGKER